jgi:hypothetical protein
MRRIHRLVMLKIPDVITSSLLYSTSKVQNDGYFWTSCKVILNENDVLVTKGRKVKLISVRIKVETAFQFHGALKSKSH